LKLHTSINNSYLVTVSLSPIVYLYYLVPC